MRYEWDPLKEVTNRHKHGIRFADAVSVFSDDRALTIEDSRTHEERYVTIGMDAFARLLLVVYTHRSANTIRLISARKATPGERKQYVQAEP